MSSIPKSQELTIEEILEEIRQQAAVPVLAARRLTLGEQSAAAQQEWGRGVDVGSIANDVINDEECDLPALLKRDDGNGAGGAKVHTFPSLNTNRLTEALRRGRTLPPSEAETQDAKTSAAAHAVAGAPDVRREIPSFLDTRFKKMSAPPAVCSTDVGVDDPRRQPAAAAESDAHLQSLLQDLQRALPGAKGRMQPGTEELLRPLLQNWLLENMPRLIEKALQLELAENIAKSGDKQRY
jgi:cell pole-organizing protein PopZ